MALRLLVSRETAGIALLATGDSSVIKPDGVMGWRFPPGYPIPGPEWVPRQPTPGTNEVVSYFPNLGELNTVFKVDFWAKPKGNMGWIPASYMSPSSPEFSKSWAARQPTGTNEVVSYFPAPLTSEEIAQLTDARSKKLIDPSIIETRQKSADGAKLAAVAADAASQGIGSSGANKEFKNASGANGSYVTDKDLFKDDSAPIETKMKRLSKLFPPISWKRYKTLEERVEALEDALKESHEDDENAENEENQEGGKPKSRRKTRSNKKRKQVTRRLR